MVKIEGQGTDINKGRFTRREEDSACAYGVNNYKQ